MKYTQPTFSIPTGNGRISQTEYEIRVGLRCEYCHALRGGKHECTDYGTVDVFKFCQVKDQAADQRFVTQEPVVVKLTHYADFFPCKERN